MLNYNSNITKSTIRENAAYFQYCYQLLQIILQIPRQIIMYVQHVAEEQRTRTKDQNQYKDTNLDEKRPNTVTLLNTVTVYWEYHSYENKIINIINRFEQY